jgi:hypothetical protein
VAVARKLGAMKLGLVAIDGSKFTANASKHKAMSQERMLREEVKRSLAEAEQTDKEEHKRFGRTRRGDELSAELIRREERLQRIAEALKALEERYPFGQGHTFARVDCVVDWMHEQASTPV